MNFIFPPEIPGIYCGLLYLLQMIKYVSLFRLYSSVKTCINITSTDIVLFSATFEPVSFFLTPSLPSYFTFGGD